MVVLLVLTSVLAAPSPTKGPAAPQIPIDEQLQVLLTQITRQVIPHDYQDNKHWGRRAGVVRGLYVRREGWRLKTHRTKKTVNQGTWTRYRIELLDPDQRLKVRIENLRALPNQRYALTIVCDARLRLTGRLAKWQQGVQLINISAEAETDVRLTVQCSLGVQFDFSQIPPALEIRPEVQAANLELKSFRMKRVSRVKGDLAKSLSASVRELAEREIARRNAKLLAKINHSLDKHQDQFRLSLQDTLRKVVSAGDDGHSGK